MFSLARTSGKPGTTPSPARFRAGKKLCNKALPQEETKIRDVLAGLASHGKILVVVDQPATIGALPVTVAQAAGAAVGYLLGVAMRRIVDLHRGQAKTDALDAEIIAEAARSVPHTLRSVELDDETLAELGCSAGSMTTSPDKLLRLRTGFVVC